MFSLSSYPFRGRTVIHYPSCYRTLLSLRILTVAGTLLKYSFRPFSLNYPQPPQLGGIHINCLLTQDFMLVGSRKPFSAFLFPFSYTTIISGLSERTSCFHYSLEWNFQMDGELAFQLQRGIRVSGSGTATFHLLKEDVVPFVIDHKATQQHSPSSYLIQTKIPA